jgi:hypothetical protein
MATRKQQEQEWDRLFDQAKKQVHGDMPRSMERDIHHNIMVAQKRYDPDFEVTVDLILNEMDNSGMIERRDDDEYHICEDDEDDQ